MSTLPPLSHWESLAAGLTLRNQAFIDGRWHDGQAGPLAAINPATGQLLAEVTACSQADIDQAVAPRGAPSSPACGRACRAASASNACCAWPR